MYVNILRINEMLGKNNAIYKLVEIKVNSKGFYKSLERF